jgi:hypothetical protein
MVINFIQTSCKCEPTFLKQDADGPGQFFWPNIPRMAKRGLDFRDH